MGCCGGSCSCGKNEQSVTEKRMHLVQLPGSGGILPTFDWSKGLDDLSLEVEIVEVRFKNGRKAFFRKTGELELAKNDRVVVASGEGYDLGTVSLSGKAARERFEQRRGVLSSLGGIFRMATHEDLERWLNAKKREYGVLQDAKKIAFKMGLEMSITDVDFRGDGLGVSIFYSSAGSVDLRGLVRKFSSAFRVKVEMQENGIKQNDEPGSTSLNDSVKQSQAEYN